ncbi:hypothetical protein Pelo_8397 [Pelomyxa schiedti]|nr:hypothetical protein Pelo_8397 [Pelomyxa schiedti]
MAATPDLTPLFGKWQLEATTGQFEEFLTEQGMGFLMRKAALSATPTCTMSQTNPTTVRLFLESTFKNREDILDITGKPEAKTGEGPPSTTTTTVTTHEGSVCLNSVAESTSGTPVTITTKRFRRGDKMITTLSLTKAGKTVSAERIFHKLP